MNVNQYQEKVIDSYEAICDRCRDLSDQMDLRRWEVGDYALLVETHYGENTADDFAKDIGCNGSTVRNWKRVSKFYEHPFREEQIEMNPNLTYTYFRDALRLGNDKRLVSDWLAEVSSMGWSADQAARKLTERLGHKTQESIPGIIENIFERDGKGIIEIAIAPEDMEYITKQMAVNIKTKAV